MVGRVWEDGTVGEGSVRRTYESVSVKDIVKRSCTDPFVSDGGKRVVVHTRVLGTVSHTVHTHTGYWGG